MSHPELDELWRNIAGDIVKQLNGERITGRFRFLGQISSSKPAAGRITFTVGALLSEADYRLRGMSDREFWLAMQRDDHRWGAVLKASGLSLDFFPNEEGQSVETVTFWLSPPR